MGSKITLGIIFGILIAIISLFFLSNALPLYLVLIISISIIILITIIGYLTKNKYKKFKIWKFDEKLINHYY